MLRITSSVNLNLLLENLLFLVSATLFLVVVSWAWRYAKPYELPQPLPRWFKIWFLTVQVGGVMLPLVVLLLWGVWWGYVRVLTVLVPYFVVLGLQIRSEGVALRQFHSVVWVMVPYLYVPYRVWQLYEGLMLLGPNRELIWVQNLLLVELVLWTLSYALNLSQLPRLLRWEVQRDGQIAT